MRRRGRPRRSPARGSAAVTSSPRSDPPPVAEVDRVPRASALERRPVVERDALVQREPGQGAIHRPGVEVVEAEPESESLARPSSSRRRRARRWRRSSVPPIGGNARSGLERHRAMRSFSSGTAQALHHVEEAGEAHGDAVGSSTRRPPATRARRPPRASRCGGRRGSSTRPPRGAPARRVIAKPSLVACSAHAERTQRVDRRVDPVGLLRPSSSAPWSTLSPRAHAAREGEQRQLVDRERHLRRCDRRRDELGASASRCRRPARPRSARGCTR